VGERMLHAQAAGLNVKQVITAPLRFEHQRKAGVFGGVDAFDRVHYDGN
jgi:hypothetical protein